MGKKEHTTREIEYTTYDTKRGHMEREFHS